MTSGPAHFKYFHEAAVLGVTEFITINVMSLVTLCSAAQVWL
jgi:hypothetical protein